MPQTPSKASAPHKHDSAIQHASSQALQQSTTIIEQDTKARANPTKLQRRMMPPTNEQVCARPYIHTNYPDWHQIAQGVLINSKVYFATIHATPCLQTKLLAMYFKVPDTIWKYSVLQQESTVANKPHPLKLGYNPYVVPPNYQHSIICQEVFSCGHPTCLKQSNTGVSLCTFKYKWIIHTDSPFTMNLYIRGQHAEGFQPTLIYAQRPYHIEDQIRKHFDTRGKPLVLVNNIVQEAVKNNDTTAYLPSTKQLSNFKYYNKTKARTHEDQFIAFKIGLFILAHGHSINDLE